MASVAKVMNPAVELFSNILCFCYTQMNMFRDFHVNSNIYLFASIFNHFLGLLINKYKVFFFNQFFGMRHNIINIRQKKFKILNILWIWNFEGKLENCTTSMFEDWLLLLSWILYCWQSGILSYHIGYQITKIMTLWKKNYTAKIMTLRWNSEMNGHVSILKI